MDYAIKKSTTPLIKPLKQKHMNTLCELTYHREIHMLFRALGRSMREPNWIVVFKSLILIHILMREGNTDAVIREVLEYPEIIDTHDFRDKSMNSLSVAQSKNIRHYSLYLREKVAGFGDMKVDFVAQKSEIISRFRTASVDNHFLKQLAILQRQIKSLLDCSFYADEIDNVVTLQAFRLLVGDMMSLFHIMNEGVIRLLSGYFDLPREEAQKGLVIYKTFATQTTKTVEFFEIARKLRDSLGVEVPRFKHAPLSLAGALEDYLNAPDFDLQQQAFQAKKQASNTTNNNAPAKKVAPPAVKPQVSNEGRSPTRAPSPTKSPEVLIDFFASTDTAAIDAFSFNMPTVNTWAPSGMALSGSSGGAVTTFPGASNSFAFNSAGSSAAGVSAAGNPFAQQGFANPGLNGFPSTDSSQFAPSSSGLAFGQQLSFGPASTQFSQAATAHQDPSFTVENVFGSTATNNATTPVGLNSNPFGSAPNHGFGAVQPSSSLSNNPFGSAPAVPASNNPFQSQAQPPLPQQFKSSIQQPQQQQMFNQPQSQGFGTNQGFPSASPMMQQQQLGMGGIMNQASPLMGQQQQFSNGLNSSGMMGQQPSMQFNSNTSGIAMFGGTGSNNSSKPGFAGPTSQVVDHFAGVNPFAKPNIPLSAMGSGLGGVQSPSQMSGNGLMGSYGGNGANDFNALNNGMGGMSLNGSQNGMAPVNGFPSVQKNNSNNPFFK
ncbi:ANTH domain-containing protein [Obelidium mucronatum]|nr:ANTH domain-containing protein [Obelidium mucronatum]